MDIRLPDTVKEVRGGGLTAYDIETRYGSLRMYEQGAHLTSCIPRGQRPLLWMSNRSRYAEGQPFRGGVPICGPWFGRGVHSDREPLHGKLRIGRWRLAQPFVSGAATYIYMTTDEGSCRYSYRAGLSPHPILGNSLALDLTVLNLGPEAVDLELILHVSLPVGDICRCNVKGLQGRQYRDRSALGHNMLITQREELVTTFGRELDRLYSEPVPVPERGFEVNDPVWAQQIRVLPLKESSVVVWNPGPEKAAKLAVDPGDFGSEEWRNMLCFEVGYAGPEGQIHLRQGDSGLVSVRYGIRLL